MYLFIIIFFIFFLLKYLFIILLFLIIVFFYFYFIFRVKFENGQVATIGNLQNVTITAKDDLILYIINRLGVSNEAYLTTPIISIIISYGIRTGVVKNLVISTFNPDKSSHHIYYNSKLPIGTKPNEYGKILSSKENLYFISNGKAFITLTIEGKINTINYYKDGQLLYSWTDKIINDNYFIREIGKSCYHFKNNKLILKKIINLCS